MKKVLIILILQIICSYFSLYSQNFEGKITDQEQNPIMGSLILIRETYQGVACSEDGKFQLNLKPGTYTVDFRSLGYRTKTEQITIKENLKISKKIILEENPVILKEVLVLAKEDPAYNIIKNTIEKAPYHQNIIKEYHAECYIKGNMELTEISGLMDRMININGGKPSKLKNHLFIQESFSEIKYKIPDQYNQTVKAFSSTIPDNFNPKQVIPLAINSLYLPRFSNYISPLNPNSFSYYNFIYEGYLYEKGEIINKIKVIPKVNDPELLEGYLYIADNSWDIRHANLKSNVLGIEQHINITYDKLGDIAYMPATFSNQIRGKVLGTEGYFNYFASIKYLEFTINDSINNAHQKQQLTKNHNNSNKNSKTNKKNFYKIKSDSSAMQKDSSFWTKIRNIPLSNREKHSYHTRDSFQRHFDSVRNNPKKPKLKLIDLLTGGKVRGDSTFVTFTHAGIPGVLRDYNFVDGYGWGYKFSLSKKSTKKNNSLTLTPEIYYASARKSIVWKTEISYTYAPHRLGQLYFSSGNITSDFNSYGVNRQDNAMSSFFWGRNAIMFYKNRFAKITNHINLNHTFRLSTELKWANRSPLQNKNDYSIFKGTRKVKPNLIDSNYTNLLSYTINLDYTPRYYYTIYGDQKKYIYANSPTFSVNYSEGFSSWKKDNSRYRKLQGTIQHEFRTDLFSTLNYKINVGAFLGQKNKMNIADYKHFDTTGDLMLIAKLPFSSLMLLDPYVASTNDFWISSQLNYRSKYILLTIIPFLQGKFLHETFHLKYLLSPNQKNYIEVGYSIDLLKSFSAGIHCSFDKFRFDTLNTRFSIKMNFFNRFSKYL